MEVAVKIIKLVSGETIVALTDVTVETLSTHSDVILVDPVTVRALKYADGGVVYESLVMQHWISMASSASMVIPAYHVVTVVTPKETVSANYLKFVEESKTKPENPYDGVSEYTDDEIGGIDEYMSDLDDEYDDREKPTYH